jgi:hypothetical protein
MTVFALSLACRRDAPRTPGADPAPRGNTAVEAPRTGAADSEEEHALPDGYCHPATVISTGRGGVIIDACFDPQTNQTDLIGQRVDADAMAVGARVPLRRIPGNVVSLAAAMVDGSPRVAWVAHVGDGAERSDEFTDRGRGQREVAVQTLSPTLALVGEPIHVHRYGVAARAEPERQGWARSRVELATGPEHAVLLLTTDAEEPCPGGRQRCASWSVFSVGADGTARRVRHEASASASFEPQSLIRVGDELSYVRGADAVRSTLYVHSVHLGNSGVSTMPSAMFDPLPNWLSGSIAWTGSAIVTLGEERPIDQGVARLAIRVTSLSGPPPTRPRPSDEPDTVRWPLVTERTWRCVRRHPVLRIAWRGGAVELDPTTPGASFDLSRWLAPSVAGIPLRVGAPRWLPPMAWTGRALLAIDGFDRLRRWTCPRDGDPPTE